MKIAKIDRFSRLFDAVSDIYTGKHNRFHVPAVPDLNIISDKPILHSLLKLFVNSTDYKLQYLTLSLIIRCFKQRQELLQSIKRLYVIYTDDDKLLIRWLKVNLKEFKQESEQSELWLNYWKHTDANKAKYFEKFTRVMNFLKELDHIFYEETYIDQDKPVFGKNHVISKSRQDILYYLGAHELIIRLLKDGMHTLAFLFDKSNPEFNEPRQIISDLFRQCHRVLIKFVYAHTKNQKRVHKQIHIFLQHLRINLDQIPLICEIYRENAELIMTINKDIFKPFKRLIYNEGRQPAFLEFFETIQVVKTRPMTQVQRMIMNFFFKLDFNRYLLYMDDQVEPEFVFQSQKPAASSWTYKDVPYEYHARLLNVISQCGFGVSGMYMNETKCQKIVRLALLFKLLSLSEQKNGPYGILKLPLLDFFYNIYIDVEKINEELKLCSEFFGYIREQAYILGNRSSLDSYYLEFLSIFVKILLKYCNSYLNNRDIYSDKEDFSAILLFSQTLVSNHAVFYTKRASDYFLNDISALCDRFKLDFPSIVYDETGNILLMPSVEGVLLSYRSKYQLTEKVSEVSES